MPPLANDYKSVGYGRSVPNGFTTTADAFNQFLDQSGVNQRIYERWMKPTLTTLCIAKGRTDPSVDRLMPFQSELEMRFASHTQLSADDEASVVLLRDGGRYAGRPSPSAEHSWSCRALTLVVVK